MWKRAFLFSARIPIAGDFLLGVGAGSCAPPLRNAIATQTSRARGRPHIEFHIRDVRMIYQTAAILGALSNPYERRGRP